MIVEKDTDREQLGRMVGERVEMKFSDAARGILMDNFARNLYSRPKEAVLREYSTNAWDAQVEVGVTKPIEVTLPSPLSPTLQIRDFGVGLDQQGIVDVYSQYGASTKRESNDFNGTLGLGGKSAFAYSNQFNVVSVKGGVRIEVQVTRNEDGTGDMVTVDERPSDEPTGTLIKIPARRGDDFKAEAAKLYRWFPEGSVKVNGQIARHFDPVREEAIKVADGIYVVKNANTGQRRYSYEESDDFIVMGMIAYPARLDTDLERSRFHVVAYAPMGAVQFNPNRETLLNNSVTRRGLEAILEDYRNGIISTVQAHIDAAETRPQAAAIVATWRDIVPAKVAPKDGYKYKGEYIPTAVNVTSDDPYIRTLRTLKSGYHNSHGKTRTVSNDMFAGAMWVEGYTAAKVTSAQAQKARKYIADQELSCPNGILLISEIPADVRPWLETVVPYETVKAVKLPQAARTSAGPSGRIAGSYDLYTTDPSQVLTGKTYRRMIGVPAETFKTWAPPLYYAIGNSYDTSHIREALAAVCGAQGYTLISIGSAREAKLVRNFPSIAKAIDTIRDGYAAWEANVGKDVPLALAIQGDSTTRDYKFLAPGGQITDPELAKYADLAAKDLTSLQAQSNVFARVLGRRLHASAANDLIDFEARYPLLENMPSYSPDVHYIAHMIHYVNSVYTARQSGATL